MGWEIIIGTIAVGMMLLAIEFFFIPGTSVVAILGGIVILSGVYLAFVNYGNVAGVLTLLGAGIGSSVLLYAGYKTFASNKYAVHSSINGRVNVMDIDLVHVGDKGTTISHLRPNGKAIFGNKKIEVYSMGDFIKSGVEVQIAKIEANKVYIKLI